VDAAAEDEYLDTTRRYRADGVTNGPRPSRTPWRAALTALGRSLGERARRSSPSATGSVSGDEPLASVDVVSRAGDGGVDHEVNGEGGDVGRFDDAPDRRGGA